MGPPSYMRPVVDRNVVMRRIPCTLRRTVELAMNWLYFFFWFCRIYAYCMHNFAMHSYTCKAGSLKAIYSYIRKQQSWEHLGNMPLVWKTLFCRRCIFKNGIFASYCQEKRPRVRIMVMGTETISEMSVYLTTRRGCQPCSITLNNINNEQSDVHVAVHRAKFVIVKPTRCTNFSNLFLEWNSTCFRQFLSPSSGIFLCTHSSGVCHTDLLTAYEQVQNPDPARKLSADMCDIYHYCVYSGKLLMMDRGTVRNM
jgi:hypothetical protein